MSAGLWPDRREGSEAQRGSHINRLFHLQRCATVCVTEVEEARGLAVYRGVVKGKWQVNGPLI